MIPLLLRVAALVAVFASVVLIGHFALNFILTRQAERRAVNQRLEILRSGETEDSVITLLRANRTPSENGANPVFLQVYRTIDRADIKHSPQLVLAWMTIASVAIFVVALAILIASGRDLTFGALVLLATFAGAIGLGIPLTFLNRSAQKRRKRLEEQFPTAIEIFTRALRAGHPITAAIELLTEEMEDPIGSEFGLVADEVSYGADLGESLASMARRWDLADVKMFAVCLSVQNETGGNLAEILGNLTSVIRERSSLYLMVRALSAEGRISALMLSVLPVLTFVLLFALNPAFYLDVAGDPMFFKGYAGLLAFYVIGVVWIRRMVQLKV